MLDKPHRIHFGQPEHLDVPLPRNKMQYIATHFLGLPESLISPPPESKIMTVLELYSGSLEDSFKPEVIDRNRGSHVSNYTGVDLNESTGLGHEKANVHEIIKEFPPYSFDFIIMNHPPIWFTMARSKKWKRENSTRLVTPTLANAEEFTKFLAECTKLVVPKRGNRISVAHGFAEQDFNALWRHASQFIPHYNEWTIAKVPTGQNTPFSLVDDRGYHDKTLHFPEFAFQLIHL